MPNPSPPIADTPPFEWDYQDVGGGFFTMIIRCGPPQVATILPIVQAEKARLIAAGAKLIGGVIVTHHGQTTTPIP